MEPWSTRQPSSIEQWKLDTRLSAAHSRCGRRRRWRRHAPGMTMCVRVARRPRSNGLRNGYSLPVAVHTNLRCFHAELPSPPASRAARGHVSVREVIRAASSASTGRLARGGRACEVARRVSAAGVAARVWRARLTVILRGFGDQVGIAPPVPVLRVRVIVLALRAPSEKRHRRQRCTHVLRRHGASRAPCGGVR
jgi:hypothetical protein